MRTPPYLQKVLWPLALGALLALQACSGDGPVQPRQVPPSDAEIIAYLQAKAEALYPNQPGLRLTDFKFSDDRKIVCGVSRAPGAEPQVFASPDATPLTLERPLSLRYLAGSSTPEVVRLERQRAMHDDVCERNGLMPDIRGEDSSTRRAQAN